jgi:hypothetical protein
MNALLITVVDVTVYFDNEAHCRTAEVEDERAKGILTPELEAARPPVANLLPQNTLCRCHLPAEAQ